MFLISGTLYDEPTTNKYNMIYAEELKKHKDHKQLLLIKTLKMTANDMTLNEMKMCNHKNLKEFVRLNIIALNGLKSIMKKKLVPMEYGIESLSIMKLGITSEQFQNVLMETMEEDVFEEYDIVIRVIEKLKLILESY